MEVWDFLGYLVCALCVVLFQRLVTLWPPPAQHRGEETKVVYINRCTVSVQTEEDGTGMDQKKSHGTTERLQNKKLGRPGLPEQDTHALPGRMHVEQEEGCSSSPPQTSASQRGISLSARLAASAGGGHPGNGMCRNGLLKVPSGGGKQDESLINGNHDDEDDAKDKMSPPRKQQQRSMQFAKTMSSASSVIHTIEESTAYTHMPSDDSMLSASVQSVVLLPSRAASSPKPMVANEDGSVRSVKRPQAAWGKSFSTATTRSDDSGGPPTNENHNNNNASSAVVLPWRRPAYAYSTSTPSCSGATMDGDGGTPAGTAAQEGEVKEVLPWRKRESVGTTSGSTNSPQRRSPTFGASATSPPQMRVISPPPGLGHGLGDIPPVAPPGLEPKPATGKEAEGNASSVLSEEKSGRKSTSADRGAREGAAAVPYAKALTEGTKIGTCDAAFFTASKAIQDFGKQGKWEQAVGVLRSMKDMNVKPNVVNFNLAISACGQKKQWECALKLLQEMQEESVEPNVITYNTAISACGKAMMWDRAMGLLEHMKTKHVQPDKLSYNATISACGKGMQPEMALNLLEEMKQLSVKPDVISYNASISACGVAQKWENALLLLDDMKQQRLEPDVISYNAAISACEKGARADKALELLESMGTQRVIPNIITYSAAISACEKGMKWEKALELLEEMKQWNIQPSVIAYSAAISACEKGVQPEMAMKLLEKMKTDNLEPSVISYTSAISACAKGLLPEKALDLFKEMKSNNVAPNVISYNAAISACEKAALPEKALELLNEMRGQRVKPDKISYSAAISACGKGMQPEMAMKLLEDMKSQHLDPNIITYSASISACENAGRYEDAERLYREAYASRSYDHWLGGKKNCVIDFRSYPLAIAKAALRVILKDYKANGIPAKSPELIVGRGARSDGDAVLRPALLEMLKTEFHGALRTKEPKENSARLLITRSSIAAWAKGEECSSN